MNDLDWEDLRLFLLVAEAGGLSGAAQTAQISAPTLGRRMLKLEQATGTTVFHRAQTGYQLTADGDRLARHVRMMRTAALPVAQLFQSERPWVRLSAGTGTASFLAQHIAQLSRANDPFRLSFVTSEAVLDIAHRDVDLGVRNHRPQSANLAQKWLGTISFAPYHAVGASHAQSWVALDPQTARHRASRWVHEQGHAIGIMAHTVATLHQLVRSGAGIGVMPCMIADLDPQLTRAGEVVAELTEDQYLVMHNDDRHQSHIRRVIDRVARIYAANTDLLVGNRPLRA